MSKIKKFLNDNNNILVFDVDGVLAPLEYADYNHYLLDDEAWTKMLEEGGNPYKDLKPFTKMQKYISTKDINNIYVASRIMNEQESKSKTSFLVNNYNIKKENIYTVYNNEDKLKVLNKIKEDNNLSEESIGIIDDTVEVLNHVMNNSKYRTIHISTFLDM